MLRDLHRPRPSAAPTIEPLPAGGPAHLVSARQLTREDAEALFDRAEWLAGQPTAVLGRLLSGKLLGSLFYQNSTRTRLSFEAAMCRLGGRVVGFDDVRTTRAGDFFAESLTDTVRVVGQYVDCLVLRHPEDGAAARAAAVSPVPVINGGDGGNEHPTQALLDTGMLRRLLGDLAGTRIGLVGDPGCRDFRSLLHLLALFGVAEVHLLPAPGTGLDDGQRRDLLDAGVDARDAADVDELLAACDAVCMLPVQLPTFNVGTVQPVDRRPPLPDRYRMTRERLLAAGREVPILHVGPRNEELPETVDDLPSVHYFEQVRYGLYLRAALIEALVRGPAPYPS